MDKKRIGWILLMIGALLTTAGLGMVLYNAWNAKQAEISAQEALAAIQTVSAQTQPAPPEPVQTTELTVPTGPPEPETLEIVELEGDDYIGWISLPSFELEVPIMAQISEKRLGKAPCLEVGSPLTDDAVICGHNYKSHFLALHSIQPGEPVTFTYPNGHVADYAVTRCGVVEPTDLDAVLHSGHDLVLYTCTSDGEDRWAVYCDRTE